MAKKKTNAKSTKGAQEANRLIFTHKSANAEQVIETVECIDLELYTKDTEMQLGQIRKGRLLKRGRYDYKFEENGLSDQKNTHPWEVRVKLAEEKPYARISANSNGGFLNVYVPKENFKTNREFLEILLDQTELLVEKMDGIDTVGVIDKLHALKQELLEAA